MQTSLPTISDNVNGTNHQVLLQSARPSTQRASFRDENPLGHYARPRPWDEMRAMKQRNALDSLNANDRSSLAIIRRFHETFVQQPSCELEKFERQGGFENGYHVSLQVVVERVRQHVRERNAQVKGLYEPLERIPYDHSSFQEFADDDLYMNHYDDWYGDGQPTTGYTIRLFEHRSDMAHLFKTYGLPIPPTAPLEVAKELWLRFIGASEELIREVNQKNLALSPGIPANLTLPQHFSPTQPLHDSYTNGTKKINYKVPKTPTTVHIVLHSPGAAEVDDVIETLLDLQALYKWKITYGDRWLIKNIEDPTFYDIGLGCWMAFHSNPRPGPTGKAQHLTLSMMLATIQGLLDVLGLEDPEEQLSASLAIEDATWGLVGFGSISSV
ncbi:hypothetical protein P7C71_g4341, partial [Lecanoromycetidae sp. Uapishka_2]